MAFSGKIIRTSAALAAALIAAAFSGCSGGNADTEIIRPIEGETKLSYVTATAEVKTIETEEKIPAQLAFATSTTFNAPFDGKIKYTNLNKYQKVKKDDILIALDTTDLDFAINEQQLKVSAAKNEIDKGYAQIELDKMIAQRDAAIVKAPYDGVVQEMTYSAVGANIKAGTVLCSVVVPESIYVYNSQGAGKNLRFGMDVDLVINSINYKGTVTAAPDTAPYSASKQSLSYCCVEINEDDKNKLLNENNGVTAADAGWATIYAITTRRTDVLCIPEAAVKTEGSKYYCSVLFGEEKYDMPIEIGATAGGYIEIVSGINKGDVVVLSEKKAGSNKNNNNNKNDKDNENNENNNKER